MRDVSEVVSFDLSPRERLVLAEGLGQWGGPAGCTEELAVAIGFKGVEDLLSEEHRISTAINAGEPMTRRDWARALVCTEINFISDVFGTGVEWTIVTPLADDDTLLTLRAIQRKLVGTVQGVLGTRGSRS